MDKLGNFEIGSILISTFVVIFLCFGCIGHLFLNNEISFIIFKTCLYNKHEVDLILLIK